MVGRLAKRWATDVLRVGLLCGLCLAGVRARPASADVGISGWLIVLHDAETREAARAWATAACERPAVRTHCADGWNDGAVAPRMGVYATADWPGVSDRNWVVAIGPVLSRTQATAIQTATGVEAARLVRMPALPRTRQWAADVAGRWRLWSIRGPETQQEVLYLSRPGEPVVELARGWPLLREGGGAELYDIGRAHYTNPDYYFFHAGAVRRVLPATGQVAPAEPADERTIQAVKAAVNAHLVEPIPRHVEWVLPFAAAVTAELPDTKMLRRRFLFLRFTSVGWKVERDEVQVRVPLGGSAAQ